MITLADMEQDSIQEKSDKTKTDVSKKHRVTVPWNPAKIWGIPEKYRDPSFVYRGFDADKPGNIRKRLSEGWEVDKELSKKMDLVPATINDKTRLDGTTQVRELLVMRLPKEMAEQRNKYYSERRATKKEENKFVNRIGTNSYGSMIIKENSKNK